MSNFVNLLDIIYPVGSMYFSVSSTSPADTVGGTWTQIKDAVLAASGNSYSGAVNDYHGSKSISLNQMPSHIHNSHSMMCGTEAKNYGLMERGNGFLDRVMVDRSPTNDNKSILSAGGGQDYIPYHYSINVWKRTA